MPNFLVSKDRQDAFRAQTVCFVLQPGQMIARYSRPEMVALWSDEKRYETWLAVELAACESMEQDSAGFVPQGTAAAILAGLDRLRPWDHARLKQLESETHHDVVAFLQYVEERVGPPAKFLHMGLTSSDMLDTSTALLLRQAAMQIQSGIQGRLLPALGEKAKQYEGQPMIGRSHGIHAEPITLGVVFAGFYAECIRSTARIERAIDGISVGKLSGAVGIYGAASLSPALERQALQRLGLRSETVSTQVVPRDRYAELMMALSLLGAAIERWALTIRHWQRTEVGEAAEAFGHRQTGSSAMPHKKNPVLSENLCGLARLLRAEAAASLDNIALWHERDISHSSVERVVLPDVTTLADFLVHRMAGLIEGLVVYPDRMMRNIQATRGLCFSEHILLALVRKGLSRQEAYRLVQHHALRVHGDETLSFEALIAADPDVLSLLSLHEIRDCFDLGHHLRHAHDIVDRALSFTSKGASLC